MIQAFRSRESLGRVFYGIGLVSIFAWAAWRRFSLPLDPISDSDTWGYLSPALLKLSGSEFVHSQGRNFVYPGFLFLVLRVFGDFRAIVVVQHLLGLIGGGLILMTWQRVRSFVSRSRVGDNAHAALGLVLLTVFLIAGEPIRAEMQIRPEGICAFLLALNLYFLTRFVANAFIDRTPCVGMGIATAASAVVLAAVKPSFVIVALVPLVAIALFLLKQNPLRQKIALAGGFLFSTLIVWVPEYFLSRGDDLSALFLPTTLFVVHADLMRDQIAEDLKRGAALPYPLELLERIEKRLAGEIEKSATTGAGRRFPSLGFSPDDLMYGDGSFAEQIAVEFNSDLPGITSFYRFWYWRTWQGRPIGMLKKIARQMRLFYASVCPVYDRRKVIPLAVLYKISAGSFDYESYREVLRLYPHGFDLIERSAMLGDAAPGIEQGRLIRMPVAFLAGAYLPLLALTLAIAALSLRSEFRQLTGPLAILTLCVFAYNAAACLEVAIIHSLDMPRYSTVQFCFTVLAEFLAIRLVVEAGLAVLWRSRVAAKLHRR